MSQIALAEQFEEGRQQHEAAQLGMWTFLASEMLLFGGIFAGIMVYRVIYGDAFKEASHHLHLWLGSVNTAVLLTSSLTMAFAVHAARDGRRWRTAGCLGLTALLGTTFFGLKMYEYHKEYSAGLMPGVGPAFPIEQPPAELFYNLYFAGTGLHAIHLACGIGAVVFFTAWVASGRLPMPGRQTRIEVLGMYWHLVDVIWVFLFPVLYLI